MNIPTDFTQMLHMLRTEELRNTARVCGTMLSVGCNGLEYFQWIEENLGHPDLHIGLEFYLPKPEGLPDNTKWIVNTAGDMRGVANNSVDLVFAGQTIEHLWFEELAGFFIEAARVTKPGGRLLFDSPNREISNALKWNHPEHTVELSPDEATHLAILSGFDVVKCRGHWLCRDGNKLLPLTEIDGTAEWRIAAGTTAPEHSFSWWIEATRSDRQTDVIGIYAYARELSRKHFAERQAKMMQSQAAVVNGWATAPLGWVGALSFGPHAPLPPGEWLVRFYVKPYLASSSPGRAEVFQTDAGKVLAETPLPARLECGFIDVPLTLTATQFGLEFRLWANGVSPLCAKVGAEIYKRGIA